jgi:hypothetical protein
MPERLEERRDCDWDSGPRTRMLGIGVSSGETARVSSKIVYCILLVT